MVKAQNHKARRSLRGKQNCVYCNSNNQLIMELDHKEPVSKGGSFEVNNLHPCCRICNQLKGNLTHAQFKKYLKAIDVLYELDCAKIVFNETSVYIKFKMHHQPWGK